MTTTEQSWTPPADPRQVLDGLDDEQGRERSTRRKIRDLVKPKEEPALVKVSRYNGGRRTGYTIKCSTHGTMGPTVGEPLVFPKRALARAAAVDHARDDDQHPGATRLVIEH